MRRPTAALVLVGILMTGCRDEIERPRPTPTATAETPTYAERPDPSITPGNVITTDAADVCTPGWASAHRKRLSPSQEVDVLLAYGLQEDTEVSEWDHLISLQLGGGNGPSNIWPQLDHAQDQRKDRLETRLHTLVCHGQLGLWEAQARIRTFWRYW